MRGKSTLGPASRLVVLFLAIAFFTALATASAQYRSSYPYPRKPAPAPRLPKTSQHFGGAIGNPYRNDRIPPSGLPVSRNLNSYYGGTSRAGTGNPFVRQPVAKPFSNLYRPQPLITSREAARIEVARGLWGW